MTPLSFVPHPDLVDGFDAADLLAAGCRPEHMPAFELVEPPAEAEPPPRAAATRGKVPKADSHAVLVERMCAALERRGIEPDAADGWRRLADGALVTVSLKELAADVWYDYIATEWVPLGHVTDLLGVISRRARQVRRAKLIGEITGKKATDAGREALVAWVRMVTGRDDHADARVVAHWLWLVKRLATDRRTEHDLMPILFGQQGSGKSTATERLVAPLEELATTINASTLTDERRFRQLGTCLVGRWEEMQGAGRAEIESLKHTVTAHQLNYRELATHSMVVLRRTMSFIGTSNNSVDVMVGDTTGARRFYQLTTPDRLDFALMDKIDCRLVWDAVSEDERAPIHDVIEVVREAQAALVHRDAVSMWLEAETWDKITIRRLDRDEPLVVHPYDDADGCEFEDLAARFKSWCNEVGQTGVGVKELGKRLKQEGWRRTRPGPKPGQRRVWRYFKPPERPIPGPTPGPENAPPPPAAPEGTTRPPRGERMAADPSPDEDAFGGGGAFAF